MVLSESFSASWERGRGLRGKMGDTGQSCNRSVLCDNVETGERGKTSLELEGTTLLVLELEEGIVSLFVFVRRWRMGFVWLSGAAW